MFVASPRDRPSWFLVGQPAGLVEEHLFVFQKNRRQLIGQIVHLNLVFFRFVAVFVLFELLRRCFDETEFKVSVEWRQCCCQLFGVFGSGIQDLLAWEGKENLQLKLFFLGQLILRSRNRSAPPTQPEFFPLVILRQFLLLLLLRRLHQFLMVALP